MKAVLDIKVGNTSFTHRDIKEADLSRIVGDMTRTLGIDAEMKISQTENENFLTVNNITCYFPVALPEEVEGYIRFLEESGHQENADALFWTYFIQGVFWIQPQILLPEEALLACMPALKELDANDRAVSERVGKTILEELLHLRLSLQDKTRIQEISNRHLRESVLIGNDFREELIEALSIGEVGIYLNEQYFDQVITTETESNLFEMMRDGLFYETGLEYPSFRFHFDNTLPAHAFYFSINSFTSMPFIGLPDNNTILVNETPERLALSDIIGHMAVNPANGNASAIIESSDRQKAIDAGLVTWDATGYFILTFSAFLRRYGHLTLNTKVTRSYLDTLRQVYPKLIELVESANALAVCTKVLRRLAREGISIRNLKVILMAILESDTIQADAHSFIIFDERIPVGSVDRADWKEQTEFVTEYVRTNLREFISHKYSRGQNSLMVYLLDPEMERLADTDFLATPLHNQEIRSKFYEAIELELSQQQTIDPFPIILTTINVRPEIREILDPKYPQIAVLSYQELSPETTIHPLARISLT